MQTKSEMINRIAELAEEVEQWKHEYEILDACLELAQGKIAELKAYKDVNEDFKTAWEELKAENDRLKYELYVTLKEKDRWNSSCNNFYDVCKKQYQTLQEIKAIAEEWMKDYCYLDNFKDKAGCCVCHENKDCYSYRLLKALTKAEEE